MSTSSMDEGGGGSILQQAVALSHRLYSTPADRHTAQQLAVVLETLLSQCASEARVWQTDSASNMQLCELLSFCPIFLSAPDTPQALQNRFTRFSFSLASCSVQFRSYLANDLALCGPLYTCVKQNLQKQAGPQSLIDLLHLLLLLTYDDQVLLQAAWVDGLAGFLVKEVCRSPEVDWTPYCLGIMTNLLTKSPLARLRLLKSEHYVLFCRRVVKLLGSSSKFVVICSLSVIAYLEDKVRQSVYSTKLLPQTYQCIFNILVKTDDSMTRCYACDVLIRLLTHATHQVNGGKGIGNGNSRTQLKTVSTGQGALPTYNTHAVHSLCTFPHLPRCLEQTAALLATLQLHDQSLPKLYGLLLCMCGHASLCTLTCSAIRNCAVSNNQPRLITPLVAMLETAGTTQLMQTHNTALAACKLLYTVLKNSIASGVSLSDCVSTDPLLQLIDSSVHVRIDTTDTDMTLKCERVVHALALAQLSSQDETFRSDVLECLKASFCAHLAETQLVLLQPAIDHTVHTKQLNNSSTLTSVAIVLGVLELLTVLKHYSTPHAEHYRRLVMDTRLQPIIALALHSSVHSLVTAALNVLMHSATTQEKAIDVHKLSALMLQYGPETGSSNGSEDMHHSPSTSTSPLHGANNNMGEGSADMLDELMNKLKTGVDLHEPKLSQLVQVYERKISELQARERELQEYVERNQAMLQQSERIAATYRTNTHQYDKQLSDLRAVINTTECKYEAAQTELGECHQTIERMQQENAQSMQQLNTQAQNRLSEVCDELECVRSALATKGTELDTLQQENEQERSMNTMLRSHYDDMKKKFETSSMKLLEVEQEARTLTRQLKDKETMLKEAQSNVAQKTTQLHEAEQTRNEQQQRLMRLTADYREMEVARNKLSVELIDAQRKIHELTEENKKRKEMADMIHKMSAGLK